MFFKKKKQEEVSLDVRDPQEVDGHCFISGNVHINGEVQFAGTLRIDGRVDGKISVYNGKQGTLIVSKGACVNGPVEASNLIADGSIQGDVFVQKRIECRPNAYIAGDVHYSTLQMSEGARLAGRCLQRQPGRPQLTDVSGPSEGPARDAEAPSLATRDVAYLRKNV